MAGIETRRVSVPVSAPEAANLATRILLMDPADNPIQFHLMADALAMWVRGQVPR